jgi:DNA polymerase III alpha subunit
MAALLSYDSGDADQITDLIGEASLMGISIQGRDILTSREALTPDVEESHGYILFGLSAIKRPYVNVMDFMGRIDVRVVNKRVRREAFGPKMVTPTTNVCQCHD